MDALANELADLLITRIDDGYYPGRKPVPAKSGADDLGLKEI